MERRYIRNVAQVKKVGDTLTIMSDGPGVLDEKTVIAEGTDTPRQLKDRFADELNVMDFGAKGDGVTNDSGAFIAALAAGNTISVRAGKYVVSPEVAGLISRMEGEGTLVIGDTGKMVSLNKPAEVDDLSTCFFGETQRYSNTSVQSIGICDVDGTPNIFVSTQAYAPDSNWANTSTVRIEQYPLGDSVDASSVTLNVSSPAITTKASCILVGLGHGGGAEPFIDNGTVHVLGTVFGGTGFTDIAWKGGQTVESDCTYYTGLDGVGQAQVGATPDGRYVIFANNSAITAGGDASVRFIKVSVFDRSDVVAKRSKLSNVTVTKKISSSDAGTSVTLGNVYTSSATPVVTFDIPHSVSHGGISGITSDGEHIYVLISTGAGALASCCVLVYSLGGTFVRRIDTDGIGGILGGRYYGSELSTSDMRPYSTETEGIAVWGDTLIMGCKVNVCRPSAVVTFAGKHFYPVNGTDAMTGVSPWNVDNWAPCHAPKSGTVSAFSSTSSYSDTEVSGRRYIIGVCPTGSREHEYPLNYDATKRKNRFITDYYGLLGSENGASLNFGSWYPNDEFFARYACISPEGKFFLFDGNADRDGDAHSTADCLRIDYDKETDIVKIFCGSRSNTAQIHLYGANSSNPGHFEVRRGSYKSIESDNDGTGASRSTKVYGTLTVGTTLTVGSTVLTEDNLKKLLRLV